MNISVKVFTKEQARRLIGLVVAFLVAFLPLSGMASESVESEDLSRKVLEVTNFLGNMDNMDHSWGQLAFRLNPVGRALGQSINFNALTGVSGSVKTNTTDENVKFVSFTEETSSKFVIDYSTETELLIIAHEKDDKKYQIQLKSKNRMGIFVELNDSEFNYSLCFLNEDEEWPTEELLAEKTYSSKSITKMPGWVVCLIVKNEQKTGER